MFDFVFTFHLACVIGWWYVTFKPVLNSLLVKSSPAETIGKLNTDPGYH